MSRRSALAIVLGTALACTGAVAAAVADTASEIRIALPAGSSGKVFLSPTADGFVLELPLGAQLPADPAAASGGLLVAGRSEPLGADRLRWTVTPAAGTAYAMSYEPQAVVLHLTRAVPTPSLPQPEIAATDGQQYLLGPEDKIAITVHNHAELNAKVSLTEEGLITVPLVGEVQAGGLTSRQLAAKVAELLGRRYLVDPHVGVEVEEYRSRWVMVAGQVQRPQRVALRGGTRLKEALSEVGGFTAVAGDAIKISRQPDASAAPLVITIERSRFESGESNPVLAHGDIVEVGEQRYTYVQGEVERAGEFRALPGMTLLKVISLAGGLTEWADRKNVRVLSYSEGSERERIFNLKAIERGTVPDPPLSGDEVIIVRRRFL